MNVDLQQINVAVVDGQSWVVSSATLSWMKWLQEEDVVRRLTSAQIEAAVRVLVGDGSEADQGVLRAWLLEAKERNWQIYRRPDCAFRQVEWHNAYMEETLCEFALGWTCDQTSDYWEANRKGTRDPAPPSGG